MAGRWAALELCPPGSLGRKVWEFYKGRGFNFPGTPNSVSSRLAQHDFIHVVSDYGTTVESEIEVFALIAGAGPFEPGGVTNAQLQWGRDMAEAEGREYEPFGASLSPDQT